MARRTREDAPIKTTELSVLIELPVYERFEFYVTKGPPVSRDKLVQLAIDQFLRKYGMC